MTFFLPLHSLTATNNGSYEHFVNIVKSLYYIFGCIRVPRVVATFWHCCKRHIQRPYEEDTCMFKVYDSCAHYSRRNNEQQCTHSIFNDILIFCTAILTRFGPISELGQFRSFLGNDWPRDTTRRVRSFSIVNRYHR